MPEVLDWQSADPRSTLRRSVRLLAAGRLVAFPTETAYAVAAWGLVAEAVTQLPAADGAANDSALSLAVRGAAEALDWVPSLSRLARRLTRRCWPGPVEFLVDAPCGDGIANRLPEAVCRRLCGSGTLCLCMPGHDALLQTLGLLAGPLVLAPARAGGAPASTAAEVVQALGDQLALVIDDGPSPYGPGPTLVRVNGEGWQLARAGAVPAAALEQLSPCRIVFVCTGNTCRSPLAEVLCKKLLAERLACAPEDLPARGFEVSSAGLAALPGGPAAPEAVEAAQELGADLTGHRSQPLTADVVARADYLLAMTRSHVRALSAQVAGLGPEPRLLADDGQDLPDPIGCDRAVYRECALAILRHLEQWLPEFQQHCPEARNPNPP
jgi:protein-tyrosine phosphatase